MLPLAPEDVVRLLFEAPKAGDRARLRTLLGLNGGAPGRRVEVQAHRFERDGADVIVAGRVRVFGDGSLADSPATWRCIVRDGVVQRVEPFAGPAAERPAAVA